MSDTVARFKRRKLKFTMKQEKLDGQSKRLGNLRLVFFLLAAAATALVSIYLSELYGYMVLLAAIAVFVALMVAHEKINQRARFAANMVEVNRRCLQRLSEKWMDFADTGGEFVDPKHRYSHDLDLFGPGSVFQWLNSTATFQGRLYLKQLLEDPPRRVADIKIRQQAVQELVGQVDLCQRLQATAMLGHDYAQDPERLFVFAENKQTQFDLAKWRYLFYLLPLVTIAAFMAALLSPAVSWSVPLTLFGIQFAINIGTGKQVHDLLDAVFKNKDKIGAYQRLLELLERQQFKSDYLAGIRADLLRGGASASGHIKKLDQIAGAVAFKHNPLVYFALNNLLFWDFHCLMALEKWRQGGGSRLRRWVEHVGMAEALASLALPGQLDPDWCFPSLQGGLPLAVTAKKLGHPLISADVRVCNDIGLENQIAVITGSNMSGKTTLLRTIGVNLVLAYAGAPVCAQEFNCSVMEIYTSMRVTDDLSRGISTFYGELLRIKGIIDFSKGEQGMLFLIDEVFRGTNSQDRVIGARNVVLNLNLPWVIGLISTHDYELCGLEGGHGGRIMNYHFIEHYRDGVISFDYLLKPGPCRTSNAKYLMRMVGIELLA